MIAALRRHLFTSATTTSPRPCASARRGLIMMIWAAIAVIALLVVVRAILGAVQRRPHAHRPPPELIVGAVVLLASYFAHPARQARRGDLAVRRLDARAVRAGDRHRRRPGGAGRAGRCRWSRRASCCNRRSLLLILLVLAVTLILRAVNQGGTTDAIRYVPADNAFSELINYGMIFGFRRSSCSSSAAASTHIVTASFADIEQLRKRWANSAGGWTTAPTKSDFRPACWKSSSATSVSTWRRFICTTPKASSPAGCVSVWRRWRRARASLLRGGDEAVINEAIQPPSRSSSRRGRLNRSEHLVPPARAKRDAGAGLRRSGFRRARRAERAPRDVHRERDRRAANAWRAGGARTGAGAAHRRTSAQRARPGGGHRAASSARCRNSSATAKAPPRSAGRAICRGAARKGSASTTRAGTSCPPATCRSRSARRCSAATFTSSSRTTARSSTSRSHCAIKSSAR